MRMCGRYISKIYVTVSTGAQKKTSPECRLEKDKALNYYYAYRCIIFILTNLGCATYVDCRITTAVIYIQVNAKLSGNVSISLGMPNPTTLY